MTVAFNAQAVRNAVPLPKMPHALLGWTLLLVASVMLYDAYDGRGRQGPWPASTIFPW